MTAIAPRKYDRRKYDRREFVSLVAASAVCAAAGIAGEKERLMFRAQPADTYPARDAHDGVILAADPFHSRARTRTVFGKVDVLKAGFFPVLLVITNTTDKTVRMDNLVVRLITADRQKVEPTPSGTVMLRARGGKQPGGNAPRSPFPRLPRSSPSNLELQVHEFNLRMAIPGATVSGFFYFDIGGHREAMFGSKLYVTDLFWAHNAQPLLFYEIELDKAARS